MEPFAKLFLSILDSTVWDYDSDTRVVWITLLAMADHEGRVRAAIPGIVNRARVPIEAVEKALEIFQSPDPYSRTPDHEGRRIKRDGRDWVILNYPKRRRGDELEQEKERQRLEKDRERKRRWWRDNRSPQDQAELDALDALDARLDDTSAPSPSPSPTPPSPIPIPIDQDANTEEGGPGEGEESKHSASGGRKPNRRQPTFSLMPPDDRETTKPTEPPDDFTPRQTAFFNALRETEFYVRGKGILTAWDAIKDPVRLARNLGQTDAYPLVDPGLVARLGAWSLENRNKAKKDLAKFILNRASFSQERGGPRRQNQSHAPPSIPYGGDLEEKVRSTR